ncbi:UDP-xylose and UDP-N-acetylglucosamine transporter [Hondaea fermentalgiana]|uniref:UDP-xylose and UDP-N-acetylglucosamine transporter n=1 Tax=Hondaea fermentalgiana TaxID=2315210 RepID=A0A2R5GI24_9STRA|nr:UDP-xylose and UDP-N-acetylglucosamine transporter [Hondaea fermentalgiana]|eukprot:GBG30546.1 UDP-xylose and UDP-N-acetylglucosamine transporter [Hondaea fermentalgiana]
MITSRDPGAGALVTLAQFAFVATLGLPDVLAWGRQGRLLKPRGIPLWFHAFITATFFTVSLLNNMALKYHIAMPLHMVFRASSLAASLLIGWAAFGKRYASHQVQGVLLVSAGILLATWADAQQKQAMAADETSPASDCCGDVGALGNSAADAKDKVQGSTTLQGAGVFQEWLFGLGLLTVALFASAALGHFQENGYKKWGKHANELKFYSHVLALPWFVIVRGQDISSHIDIWAASPTLADEIPALAATLPAALQQIPVLWVLLLGNVLSQLVCISFVYRLTAVSSTLTCTMTITFRKFLSIIFSVVYFQNPFSAKHWLGTCLVFAGVGLYSGMFSSKAQEEPSAPGTKKTN